MTKAAGLKKGHVSSRMEGRGISRKKPSPRVLNVVSVQLIYKHVKLSSSPHHHFLSVNVNGQSSWDVSQHLQYPTLDDMSPTMGKIVANTLISSDNGVAWCFQSSNNDAMPINSTRLSCA